MNAPSRPSPNLESQPPIVDRLGQRLNWARNQLGVTASASLDDVRRRYFIMLEEENFVPDEALDRAFRTLRWESEGIFDTQDPPELIAAEEQELQGEVGKFAAEMFALPVTQRRARWAALCRRAEYAPRSLARLRALAAGLDADLHKLDPDGRRMHVKTLAQYAMELFPLRPTARAVRRQTLLQSLPQDEIKPWRKAAQTLKTQHPEFAALAPEFIDQVAARRATSKRAKPTIPSKPIEPAKSSSGWGLVVALSIFISLLVRATLQSPSVAPQPVPNIQIPDFNRIIQESQLDPKMMPPPTPLPNSTNPFQIDSETFRPNPLSPEFRYDRAEEIERILRDGAVMSDNGSAGPSVERFERPGASAWPSQEKRQLPVQPGVPSPAPTPPGFRGPSTPSPSPLGT